MFTSKQYFNLSILSSHVKELKEPFVPYLPAHRQHIQQQMASASFKTRDSVPPLSAPIVSLMGLSQQSQHVCVVHPLVEVCRSNKLRALHKQKNSYLYSFELHEVPAAEHVLQYLCYWLWCFHKYCVPLQCVWSCFWHKVWKCIVFLGTYNQFAVGYGAPHLECVPSQPCSGMKPTPAPTWIWNNQHAKPSWILSVVQT